MLKSKFCRSVAFCQAVLLLGLLYYRAEAAAGLGAAPVATPAAAPSAAPATLTFFVVSDVHYNWPTPGDYSRQRALIAQLNATPGQAYPADLGGTVEPPRGVLVLGDLTDAVRGNVLEIWEKDWGLNGERLLHFPVYEGLGNHDAHSPLAWAMEKARNQKRCGLDAVSTNGYHYSWSWSGIHFVMLNLCAANPDEADHPGGAAPHQALDFLVADLRAQVGNSGHPVILLQHYGTAPWGQWKQTQIDAFYEAIKDYNVICLLHGHSHFPYAKRWRGIDVLDDGSLKKEPKSKTPPGFFVIRIQGERLTALQREVTGQWGKIRLAKDFLWSKPVALSDRK